MNNKQRKILTMTCVCHPEGYTAYGVRDMSTGATLIHLTREPAAAATQALLASAIAQMGIPDIVKCPKIAAFHTSLFVKALQVKGIEQHSVSLNDTDLQPIKKLVHDQLYSLTPRQTVREEHSRHQRKSARNLCFLRGDKVQFRLTFMSDSVASKYRRAWEQGATQADIAALQRA